MEKSDIHLFKITVNEIEIIPVISSPNHTSRALGDLLDEPAKLFGQPRTALQIIDRHVRE